MKLIVYKNVNACYIEESQVNPLHYAILKQDKEIFTNVTNWFKCRDFFNDIVYTKQTKDPLTIYGMDSNLGLSKEEPLYILLNKTHTYYPENIALLNKTLTEQGYPLVELEEVLVNKEKSLMVTLDEFYTRCTMNISVITALLRNLNYKKLTSFSELTTEDFYTTISTRDKNILINIFKEGRKLFDKKPFQEGFVWYLGPILNSKGKYPDYQKNSAIHNNGIISWNNAL